MREEIVCPDPVIPVLTAAWKWMSHAYLPAAAYCGRSLQGRCEVIRGGSS
ncbi:hypothetical protein [Methanosarcina mazei]|nr:hypothetical protein [Methanosarcina mazei]